MLSARSSNCGAAKTKVANTAAGSEVHPGWTLSHPAVHGPCASRPRLQWHAPMYLFKYVRYNSIVLFFSAVKVRPGHTFLITDLWEIAESEKVPRTLFMSDNAISTKSGQLLGGLQLFCKTACAQPCSGFRIRPCMFHQLWLHGLQPQHQASCSMLTSDMAPCKHRCCCSGRCVSESARTFTRIWDCRPAEDGQGENVAAEGQKKVPTPLTSASRHPPTSRQCC